MVSGILLVSGLRTTTSFVFGAPMLALPRRVSSLLANMEVEPKSHIEYGVWYQILNWHSSWILWGIEELLMNATGAKNGWSFLVQRS